MNSQISIEDIKKLRVETQAPIMEIRRALEKTKGNLTKAKEALKKWSAQKAAKKQGEETTAGLVEAYVHSGAKAGSLVTLSCQTDFVARTKEFKLLAHELAMQVVASDPKDEKELLGQIYIRDPKKTIKSLIEENIAKFGENIIVKKIIRFTV